MKNTNDLRLAATKLASFLAALDAAADLAARDAVCAEWGACERCGDPSPQRTVCGGCVLAAEEEGVEETPPGQAR